MEGKAHVNSSKDMIHDSEKGTEQRLYAFRDQLQIKT